MRSVLGLVLVCLLLATPGADAPSEGAAPLPRLDRGCKPLAPIDVLLETTAGPGGSVLVDWTTRPRIALESLSWEFELPADVALLEGERRATGLATARGAESTGTLRLAVPADDSFRKAELVVTGRFTGTGLDGPTGPETVTAVRTLTWGTPPPVGPRLATPDVETGASAPVVVLPSRHRAGR